jgi:hypothetical protein
MFTAVELTGKTQSAITLFKGLIFHIKYIEEKTWPIQGNAGPEKSLLHIKLFFLEDHRNQSVNLFFFCDRVRVFCSSFEN